jgi:peptidoglycan/LPS O-acetylase OafA/YrhL
MGRIKELDGLRAIAILAVVTTHFVHESSRFANWLRLGWTGVDLFFALSGFLITGILIGLRGREASFRTFYWRRALRIFPPYYLTLVITLGLAVLHAEQINYRAVSHHALFLSSVRPSLVKSTLLRPFAHEPTAAPSAPVAAEYFLPHFKDGFEVYWSLSVEELFYLVWAPVMLKGSRRLVIFCATAPLLICPLLRGLAHITPHIDESIGFIFRFDSLAAGACIALLQRRIDLGRLRPAIVDRGLITTVALSSLGLLVLVMRGGASSGVDVRTTWLFSVLGFSLLAAMCASLVGICARWSGQLGLCSAMLRSRPASYLAKVSYTVYLFHLQVYVLVGLMFVHFFGHNPVTGSRVWGLSGSVVAAAAVTALAGLSWKYVEAPILRFKDTLFPLKALCDIQVAHELDPPDRVCA